MSSIAGVILAGGRSSRMGGGDKCLLKLGPARIIDWVQSNLSHQVAPIALSANGDPERFADLGLPVIADTFPGFPGPLAGILAGMEWAASQGASHIVTVAADTPFFPTNLAIRLAEESAGGLRTTMVVTSEDGRLVRQPTFAFWPVSLAEKLRDSLAGGTRKIIRFAEQHPLALVEFGAPDPFFNINEPGDLATAEYMLRTMAE